MAESPALVPEAKLPNDYELEAGFLPLVEVQALTLLPGERLYLDAALKLRPKER